MQCNDNHPIFYKKASFPANTKHLYNICTAAAQRLRRWSTIIQMLYKCFVFAGLATDHIVIYQGVLNITKHDRPQIRIS